MIQLKIVNPTGRPLDSRVVDAETGEAIDGVIDVTVTMLRKDLWLPCAVITVNGVHADIVLGSEGISSQAKGQPLE